jgi:hypothetical protein
VDQMWAWACVAVPAVLHTLLDVPCETFVAAVCYSIAAVLFLFVKASSS